MQLKFQKINKSWANRESHDTIFEVNDIPRVFLVWRVGTYASAIVHLSYPGVVLLGQALVIIMRFLAYEGINQNFSENFFEARRKTAVKE